MNYRTYEGKVEIDLDNVCMGVPRLNMSNKTIEISFAASDGGDPNDWSPLPAAVTEWTAIKNKSDEIVLTTK